MLSADALTARDDGRAAVDKEEEGDETTPHALLVRMLEGANTNPCIFFTISSQRSGFRVSPRYGHVLA